MKHYPPHLLQRVKEIAKDFENVDGCWIWPMGKTKAGYGQIGYAYNEYGGKRGMAYAHRASYLIFKGELARGLCVCHKCDNPSCFNPDHLFAGTMKDNMQDMANKGRSKKGKKFPLGDKHWTRKNPELVRGENNKSSKLDNAKVLEILTSPASGESLAKKFGVSPTAVLDVRSGKTWRHVSQAFLQGLQQTQHNTTANFSDLDARSPGRDQVPAASWPAG